MKVDNLQPAVRMIVRYVALGLSDEDIAGEMPEYTAGQVAKIRAGATFKRALAEMQQEIDARLVETAGEDPVRQYLRSNSLGAARVLVDLSENVSGNGEDVPPAVRAKAADSILSKSGYAAAEQAISIPVLMLSPEKLRAVTKPNVLKDVPDCVDGHTQDLPTETGSA